MGCIQSNSKIDKLKSDINKVNNITQSDLFKKKTNSKITFSYKYTTISNFIPSTVSVNIVKK